MKTQRLAAGALVLALAPVQTTAAAGLDLSETSFRCGFDTPSRLIPHTKVLFINFTGKTIPRAAAYYVSDASRQQTLRYRLDHDLAPGASAWVDYGFQNLPAGRSYPCYVRAVWNGARGDASGGWAAH